MEMHLVIEETINARGILQVTNRIVQYREGLGRRPETTYEFHGVY